MDRHLPTMPNQSSTSPQAIRPECDRLRGLIRIYFSSQKVWRCVIDIRRLKFMSTVPNDFHLFLLYQFNCLFHQKQSRYFSNMSLNLCLKYFNFSNCIKRNRDFVLELVTLEIVEKYIHNLPSQNNVTSARLSDLNKLLNDVARFDPKLFHFRQNCCCWESISTPEWLNEKLCAVTKKFNHNFENTPTVHKYISK